MLEIVRTIAPVFVLLLAGAMVDRFAILPAATGAILNGFVYRIALPTLLFASMAQAPLERIFQPGFAAAIILGTLIPYLGMAFLARRRHTPFSSLFVGFTATFSNAAFVGLPVLQLLFPQTPDTVLAMGVYAFLGLPFVLSAVFALERERAPHGAWKALGGVLSRNPLLLGSLAGLAVATWGWELPRWIAIPCQMLGHTASPLALMAIGMTLSRTATSLARPGSDHAFICLTKLALQPAITFVLLWMWGVDPLWRDMGTMLAAMPVGTMAFVLAEAYGVLAPTISAVVFFSTVLAVATLPTLFSLLRMLG